MTTLQVLLQILFAFELTHGWVSLTPLYRIQQRQSKGFSRNLSSLAVTTTTSTAANPNNATLASPETNQVVQSTTATTNASISNTISSSTTRLSSTLPSFIFYPSDCDDWNRPPSLNILHRHLQDLLQTCIANGDVRGHFINFNSTKSLASFAHSLSKIPLSTIGGGPALTPLATYCLGYGLGRVLKDINNNAQSPYKDSIRVLLGHDPRPHGRTLCDAMARGLESVGCVSVLYTGIATTPACAALVTMPSNDLDASVMVTASHLPVEKNGFKIAVADDSSISSSKGTIRLTKAQFQQLGAYALQCVNDCFNTGVLPPLSGGDAVHCQGGRVDWMPMYASKLQDAIINGVKKGANSKNTDTVNDDANNSIEDDQPLRGLRIVLNAGNGSGGFFESVLQNLGADTTGSIGVDPDPDFPIGVPNPEYKRMIEQTQAACAKVNAHVGIMLDTDADRCGFVVPRHVDNANNICSDYEALNRNRLIALFGVMLAQDQPGCVVVTDSVTSEGLSTFLRDDLGLNHVRFVKGYANVINRGQELKAALAIETSGHCAFAENLNYLDDGTYAAVKLVTFLARQSRDKSLLDWIANLPEQPVVKEIRLTMHDESMETMRRVFDFCALKIERECDKSQKGTWTIDTDNLEGIRVRLGNEGQFFMLRKSLHDPLLSLQLEGQSKETLRRDVIEPLLRMFSKDEQINRSLNMIKMQEY